MVASWGGGRLVCSLIRSMNTHPASPAASVGTVLFDNHDWHMSSAIVAGREILSLL